MDQKAFQRSLTLRQRMETVLSWGPLGLTMVPLFIKHRYLSHTAKINSQNYLLHKSFQVWLLHMMLKDSGPDPRQCRLPQPPTLLSCLYMTSWLVLQEHIQPSLQQTPNTSDLLSTFSLVLIHSDIGTFCQTFILTTDPFWGFIFKQSLVLSTDWGPGRVLRVTSTACTH